MIIQRNIDERHRDIQFCQVAPCPGLQSEYWLYKEMRKLYFKLFLCIQGVT